MKAYQTQNIRNVVLLGSTKSGKTTLSEAMLYEGKVIDRRGTVEAKNTVSDNAEIEQINQRSIYATPLYAEFMDTKFNIVDTPGADDFVGGAVSAFKVCDTGVLVVNAQQGVEVGTQIYSRYAREYGIPLIVAVNQLDGEKASWETTLESMKEAFGNKPVVVQYPVTVGPDFDGFIDVLKMKYYRFEGDTGKRQDLEIPADRLEEAEELRNALIERAAEYDDTLMETFFEQGSLSEDEIRKGLGVGIREGKVMPIFCLSAKKDIGVKRLMEFTIRTAASPAERIGVTKDGKEVECKQDAPVSIFIYKTAVEPHLGEVAYFKVMSGEEGCGGRFWRPYGFLFTQRFISTFPRYLHYASSRSYLSRYGGGCAAAGGCIHSRGNGKDFPCSDSVGRAARGARFVDARRGYGA